MSPKVASLIVRLARENSGWGYDRISGALANLGHKVSDQTVGNVLRRHGIAPAPKRQTTAWKDFIASHGGHRRNRLLYCRGPDLARFGDILLDRPS
jgi:hypothetical protein